MSLSSSLRALQIRRSRLCGPRCNALHALAEATSLPEYPSLALILVEGVRGCLVHLPGPSLAPLPPWGTGGSVAAPGRHREGPGRGESRPPYQGQPPPSLRHGGWNWPSPHKPGGWETLLASLAPTAVNSADDGSLAPSAIATLSLRTDWEGAYPRDQTDQTPSLLDTTRTLQAK